eukprot:GFUD01121477.1.p1 GENE.GFUD01121477.1~~GFUD01121477.1.p1  ORF type:complete len:319 (-),score=41.00 GFUD01121477.1:74-940(-)
MSRIFAITFCIIFSSCFPDIPFYLYWLSNSPVFKDEITPFVRETLYQADISYAPAIFLIILLVAYPIIYYQVTKRYMLPHSSTKPSYKVLLLLAITNIFCPLKPNLNFARDINDHHNLIINGAIFFSFFINNVLFLIFPFMWYGTSFFTTTLPVLDELIRYFRFIDGERFGNNPQPTGPILSKPSDLLSLLVDQQRTISLPTKIPTTILKAHIIFPVCSVLFFLVGAVCFIIYQTKFHFWAQLKPTDMSEYKQEKSMKSSSSTRGRSSPETMNVMADTEGEKKGDSPK